MTQSRRRKKKKAPIPIVTQTVEEFLRQGKGITMLPTIGRPRRLYFSSGHFNAKSSNKGLVYGNFKKTKK